MRFISTRTHGYLDYLISILLICSPWLFNFFRGGMESFVPITIGAMMLMYSFFTDYEAGTFKTIPMRTHLLMDLVGGIILAASPWLFNFSEQISAPHTLIGLFIIGESFVSRQVPVVCHTCG